MRVAVFGGAFDPPTQGHLALISRCLELDFDELWIVPSKNGWHKQIERGFAERCRLLQVALREDLSAPSRVRVVTVEQELPEATVSTYRLWRRLQKLFPTHQLTFVFGADAYRQMPTWERGTQLEQELTKLIIPRLNRVVISSTLARALLHQGSDVSQVLSPAVTQFIQSQGWYQL